MEERTMISTVNNLKIVNCLNSIFSCPMFQCPVPLPHIKLVADPNYDVIGICFICQTKTGFSIAKNYSEGEARMFTRYQNHNQRACGRTCNVTHLVDVLEIKINISLYLHRQII